MTIIVGIDNLSNRCFRIWDKTYVVGESLQESINRSTDENPSIYRLWRSLKYAAALRNKTTILHSGRPPISIKSHHAARWASLATDITASSFNVFIQIRSIVLLVLSLFTWKFFILHLNFLVTAALLRFVMRQMKTRTWQIVAVIIRMQAVEHWHPQNRNCLLSRFLRTTTEFLSHS